MNRKERAYEYLKNAILNNEIPQGAPLREDDITKTLQVSRSPIREALRQLEIEGLVISYPARGTFVATITPSDVEEIYELRAMFEMFALEKAFPRITDEDLNKAEADFLASTTWEERHKADRAFHQLFLDKCGNSHAASVLAMLNTRVERVRRYSAKNAARSTSASLAEHLRIIECLRKRDLVASRDALRDHMRNVSNTAIETCRMMASQQRSSL